MSNITNFPDHQRRSDGGDKHEDDWFLKWIAEWRLMRYRQEIAWTEHNWRTRWGTRDDRDIPLVDTESLDRMRAPADCDRMSELQERFMMFEPRSALAARELLGVVLAYDKRDPGATLAQGPLLEIVRNVMKALGWLKWDTYIGPPDERERRRKRRKASVQHLPVVPAPSGAA